MKRKRILIVGGGLAGLSAAYFLGKQGQAVSVFEREKECGGLCRSIKKNGFTFDFGGHLLHFRRKDIFLLVKRLLKGNLLKHKRSAWVDTHQRLLPYPFQANLFGLPKNIAAECLQNFIEVNTNGQKTAKTNNFRDWIDSNFGKGIARHFMVPYNLKFWKMPLENLSYEWAERFVVLPSRKDVVEGAIGSRSNNLGYNSFFWYPKQGGIEELIKSFSGRVDDIFLNSEAAEIDLKNKAVRFKNGSKEKFDILVSTIPLPELGKIIKGLPKDILSEFRRLNWLSIYNINLGVKGNIRPGQHWIYFPRKDSSFFRVGFFNNFSSQLAPRGMSSLYAEASYLGGSAISKSRLATAIKKDLARAGILGKDNSTCCEYTNDIDYAYPIYDKNYRTARHRIFKFLSKNKVVSVGRYGGWQYLSMEDVILEAQATARSI
ncbi:MAG: FAD-dependent oxidoreductase [Candidatus Omnitrophica bacterium]|nr:FAD-dependent oxidoreductase [Candidatus Omnitrophota bacterium]